MHAVAARRREESTDGEAQGQPRRRSRTAPDADTADRAATAKAAMFDTLGIDVHVCGVADWVNGGPSRPRVALMRGTSPSCGRGSRRGRSARELRRRQGRAAGRRPRAPARRCAVDLGPGWKISPSVDIEAGATFELAAIDGPAQVTAHLADDPSLTTGVRLVLRAYWDGDRRTGRSRCRSATSSDRAGASSHSSAPCRSPPTRTAVSTRYWPMPFGTSARLTHREPGPDDGHRLLPDHLRVGPSARAIRRWRDRGISTPSTGGTTRWWLARPTDPRRRRRPRPLRRHVHRLGREPTGMVGRRRDQVLPRRRRRVADDLRHRHRGLLRWGVELRRARQRIHGRYSTPFLGLHQVIRPDGLYRSQQRFGMYRWHVLDPIHFATDSASTSRRSAGSPATAINRYRRHRLDRGLLPRPSATARPELPALDDLAVSGVPIDPLRRMTLTRKRLRGRSSSGAGSPDRRWERTPRW